MVECLFCRIVAGEIPAERIFENEQVVVFSDIKPQAPIHYLIVPKKHRVSWETFEADDWPTTPEIFKVVKVLKKKAGVDETGYRLVINSGPDSGQEVPHLHLHFLAGRRFGWPPG
jgi:histidine triad (HIT) family protein